MKKPNPACTGLEREVCLCGLQITVRQAGPLEFVAIIQTPDGDELARTAHYALTPAIALSGAVEGIQKKQLTIPPEIRRKSPCCRH